ncbi:MULTISPECIES: flagellar hook protein FlgE [Nitrosomonas]|uniref:flagellar hook protein FlgE n=1 Tax=Nitrosomonas TaxID=914 RepID=UPI001934EE19|nr:MULTISPECIES: flagellar hook protein FlgE [Nitrosomonas]QOJ09588.1 MAG: flagellar hook protein FlgE [Nitrosomonas sp. H1_AOB3]HRO56142.1 flagellar hook protein FlgE [Nitrosomonas europaea]HUM73356.1 flagellar hook protein FlgE [Nitrosomonas europaea]
MGFQHGLSGLKAASAKLDVTGNNIANANTVGFKQSQAQFADVYANALGGGRNQIGIGTQLAAVAQEFNQGNVTPTNNPLDVAITGNGFFRMDNNGTISFTRNGQFHLDKDGFLVNASNYNVTGFGADAAGTIIPNVPVNLRLPTADMTPKPTTSFMTGVNLDARVDHTDPDPDKRTFSTSGEVFDSFGNSHILSLSFEKTAASAWDVFATVEGVTSAGGGAVTLSASTLNFDSSGIMDSSITPFTVNVNFDDTSIQPLQFSLDLTRSTQFGSKFGVNMMSQDGFASGRLAGYSISDNGEVRASYTNNVTRTVGQLALAGFSNPNGLKPMGSNQWAETAESGLPLVGAPETGVLGSLQSSAVEESNVDLTTELVSLIMTQRVYQANAKTIETQDAVMQTIMNI